MKQRLHQRPGKVATSLAAAAFPLLAPLGAHALEWNNGDGLSLDLDTTLAYSVARRMESPSAVLLTGNPIIGPNADDGNRNFDKGDLTTNRFTAVTDLNLNHQDYGGVFVRGRAWYDFVYAGDPASGNASTTGTCNRATGSCATFSDAVEDYHKKRAEILDAFVYTDFNLPSDSNLSLRAGRQVISWGESMFLHGGISAAQNPLDVSKLNIPGTELKEAFLPQESARALLTLTPSLSLEGYYRWGYQRSRIDAPGSYMGTADFVGEGAERVLIPVGPGIFARLPVVSQEPDNEQGYGVAVRYLADWLNSTEFGLYHINYDDTLPSVQLLPAVFGPRLVIDYFEDVKLYGASFGTTIGDTNVSGEVNYRDGQPVQLAIPGAFYYAPARTVQAQASVIHVFGPSSMWDNLSFIGEVGWNYVVGIDDPRRLVNRSTEEALDNDRSAWGFIASVKGEWYNVYQGVNLTVGSTYRQDVRGKSAVPFTFTEGVKQLSLAAELTYNQYSAELRYTNYLTNPADIGGAKLELAHLNADRDFLSLILKYRF